MNRLVLGSALGSWSAAGVGGGIKLAMEYKRLNSHDGFAEDLSAADAALAIIILRKILEVKIGDENVKP